MLSPTQKIKVANRRAKVAHLKLTEPNLSESAIAARLGKIATQQTISNDLKAIQEEWKQSTLVEFGLIKGIQLARLEKIYDELWKAWEKSKTDAVSITKHRTKQETKSKTKGKKSKPQMLDESEDVRREYQCGDPRYMKLLMENVQMQCDLFGISVKGKDELTSTPQIVAFNVVVPQSVIDKQQPKQVEQILTGFQETQDQGNNGVAPDNVQFDLDSDSGENDANG